MTKSHTRRLSLLGLSVAAAAILIATVPAGAQSRDTDGQAKHTEVVDLAFAKSALRLTVDSMCRRGKVVFRMKNDGNSWPGMARMQVIDADNGDVISGRSMKLKANQSAGFSIRPESKVETMSLRIEAAWLPEPYEHAVGQSCQ